ncbi:MAG TPA: hypothetical protein VN152_09180 [Sphingopyxis sp.]|nr:hypothetical protein [Sphingopyxis sp.]
MVALRMMITDAGRDAIVNAQEGGTDTILIEELGLTDTPFVMAPTLTALPGEFRRLASVGGQAIAEDVIHVTAYDPEQPLTYDVTGFGLYDGAGTLIAVHSAEADPILSKAAVATSLFVIDIKLSSDVAAVIEFGEPLFLNPPATETVAGVVKLATEAQADAGADDTAAMTPAMVQRMIDRALFHKIMMWSGAIVDIPSGWHLCDGTGGTPDLRDRFIVGAGSTYAVSAVGGAVNHDHDGDVGETALTEAQIPGHRHHNVIPGIGDGALAAGNALSQERTLGGDTQYILSSGGAAEPSIGRTSNTGGGAAHDHPLTIESADHRPPYFALAFIMKV